MKRNILFLESIGLQEVKSAFSTKPAVHFNHKAKSVRTVVDTNVAKPTTRSLRPRVNKNYKS